MTDRWQLVPVIADEAMLKAAMIARAQSPQAFAVDDLSVAWSAMLKAAPTRVSTQGSPTYQGVLASADVVKVFTIAHVPVGLEQQWLQHLRDFDTAHPGCHFEVALEGPEKTLPEMVEMLRVEPELTFTQLFERKGRSTTKGD